MAANSPAAVVMSASAMPGATIARFVDEVAPMLSNAAMIPQTVPNRPMNGVMLAVVARKVTRLSSRLTSMEAARISARSSAGRLRSVGRAGAPGNGRSGRRLPELAVQLGVARLENPHQRAGAKRLADGLDL